MAARDKPIICPTCKEDDWASHCPHCVWLTCLTCRALYNPFTLQFAPYVPLRKKGGK